MWRAARWGLLLISVLAPLGCGSGAESVGDELCAETACEGRGCASSGSRLWQETRRQRCTKNKKQRKAGADAGAAVDATPPVAPPQDDAVFPCAICARADNCCKAQGVGGCAYRSACTSARTTDEVAYYSALCRILVESGPPPAGAGCGSR